ncbi:hypothetical protein [Desulfofalx alkaliphila]|uniref:hypothetical protein n=1 Tax=Desulfofalx alkaliphila TaxID=105483 RepID=UPI0004E15F98|nr:hypothetical protein [Desulfofalx alkaliphila]
MITLELPAKRMHLSRWGRVVEPVNKTGLLVEDSERAALLCKQGGNAQGLYLSSLAVEKTAGREVFNFSVKKLLDTPDI